MYLFVLLLVAVALYIAEEPLRYRWHLRRFSRVQDLEERFRLVIAASFPYYINLSSANKLQFERRLQYVIRTKQFYTFDGLAITDQMIALTAASAVQLTFGLQQFWLPNVKAIIIYPGSFKRYKGWPKFRGEFTERGFIRLSWPHFLRGYLQPRDGVNLGLHEMAHALMHLHVWQFTVDEYGPDLDVYTRVSASEMYRVRNKENEFLRGYAGTNMHEMFAVCVEYFFVVPELFQRELPELYDALSRLLNQHPVRHHEPVWIR